MRVTEIKAFLKHKSSMKVARIRGATGVLLALLAGVLDLKGVWGQIGVRPMPLVAVLAMVHWQSSFTQRA
jgi:hypothetical protein